MAFLLRIEMTDIDKVETWPRRDVVEASHSVSLGRDPANDVVLVDKGRTISKRHCVIEEAEGRFQITDYSRNGTFLNSDVSALPRGVPVPLATTDNLRVGCFSLAVRPLPGAAGPRQRTDTTPIGMPVDVDGGRSSRSLPGMVERNSLPVLDAAADAEPFADFHEPAMDDGYHSISADYMPGRAATADHVLSEAAVFVQPATRREPIPDDWDAVAELGLMGVTPATVFPKQSTTENTPVRPVETKTPILPQAFAPNVPHDDGAKAVAAIDAFLGASGLAKTDLATVDMVGLMEQAGHALRLSVTGLHEILSARAQTKQGFGIEPTLIGHFSNNPLKYISGEHEAMRALLVTAMPGFLVGADMIQHAFADIKNHQVAMLSAMRAALASICHQLKPATIVAKSGRRTLLQRLLPMAWRSHCWKVYAATFEDVAAGIDNDATRVFGDDFARAYRSSGPGGANQVRGESARSDSKGATHDVA